MYFSLSSDLAALLMICCWIISQISLWYGIGIGISLLGGANFQYSKSAIYSWIALLFKLLFIVKVLHADSLKTVVELAKT
jgi:hypothetical protein